MGGGVVKQTALRSISCSTPPPAQWQVHRGFVVMYTSPCGEGTPKVGVDLVRILVKKGAQ